MNYIEKYEIIIKEICEETVPGKKMLQKLLYLMERKGVDLALDYSIHYYGPYSSKLDTVLHIMDNDGIVNIDTSGRTHKIQLGTAAFEGELPKGEQTKVSYVIEKFLGKSAQELEAITTLDYAAVNILKGKADDEQIIEQVLRIKGSKFKREYLSEELEFLKREGFVGCPTGIAAG